MKEYSENFNLSLVPKIVTEEQVWYAIDDYYHTHGFTHVSEKNESTRVYIQDGRRAEVSITYIQDAGLQVSVQEDISARLKKVPRKSIVDQRLIDRYDMSYLRGLEMWKGETDIVQMAARVAASISSEAIHNTLGEIYISKPEELRKKDPHLANAKDIMSILCLGNPRRVAILAKGRNRIASTPVMYVAQMCSYIEEVNRQHEGFRHPGQNI